MLVMCTHINTWWPELCCHRLWSYDVMAGQKCTYYYCYHHYYYHDYYYGANNSGALNDLCINFSTNQTGLAWFKVNLSTTKAWLLLQNDLPYLTWLMSCCSQCSKGHRPSIASSAVLHCYLHLPPAVPDTCHPHFFLRISLPGMPRLSSSSVTLRYPL